MKDENISKISMPVLGRGDSLSESQFYDSLESIVPGDSSTRSGDPANSRIYLSRLDMSGLHEMHEYSTSDNRFYEYLEYEPFKSLEDTTAYLQNLIQIENGPIGRSTIAWFIRRMLDNKIVGTARLVNIDYRRQSVSWGYGLDPKLWGQGYVQELQRILLDYVFNTLCLNRLYGTAVCSNKQTIATLRSVGMVEEGIHRQAMRSFSGEYLDTWAYSMLYEHYQLSKAWISSIQPQGKVEQSTHSSTAILNIKSKLYEYFSDYDALDDDLEFTNLPFWDSLSQMQLVAYLEAEFDIILSLDQVIQLNTIHGIVDILTNSTSSRQ